MAVSKLWAVNSRLGQVIDYAANPEKTAVDIYSEEQYQALADVLSYAKDEEKTEREYFVEGINCNPTTARDQFVSVKQAYGKEDGIQAYHGYLSFKEQNITPELAQKIGMEFANEVWGKALSNRGDDTPEHQTPALPFRNQLCVLCRWQKTMGRRKSLVQVQARCRPYL